MNEDPRYHEVLTSTRTELLFIGLALLPSLFLAFRLHAAGFDLPNRILAFLSGIFLFYSINYRKLVIRLSAQSLRLTFGLVSWTVPLDNVQDFGLDHLPALMRLGGAGIHFMLIQGRYRASFNFLEYPRVVVGLKRKVGWVQEISFSTRRPEELLLLLKSSVPA